MPEEKPVPGPIRYLLIINNLSAMVEWLYLVVCTDNYQLFLFLHLHFAGACFSIGTKNTDIQISKRFDVLVIRAVSFQLTNCRVGGAS
jgi:hypothetical protein